MLLFFEAFKNSYLFFNRRVRRYVLKPCAALNMMAASYSFSDHFCLILRLSQAFSFVFPTRWSPKREIVIGINRIVKCMLDHVSQKWNVPVVGTETCREDGWWMTGGSCSMELGGDSFGNCFHPFPSEGPLAALAW